MTTTPLTDRNLSHRAQEFEWDVAGETESQNYLLPPVLATLERHGASSVLDLGCGNGAMTARLAAHGLRVQGCDGSRSGIDAARRAFPHIEFSEQDLNEALDTSLQGRFDAVVSTEVIEHLLLPRKLMDAARFALRPGGLFVVTTPFHGYWKNLALAVSGKFDAHWHPLRDFGHVKFFSRPTLTSLFHEYGFDGITFTTVGRVPALARSMIVSGTLPR